MTTRADWRFLLPPGTFRHLALVGGSPELASRLREAGAAATVSEALEEGADAIAVLDGAEVSPSKAARCLAPGGWLYWEWDRRPTLRSARPALRQATALLRASGLAVAGIWAVWPSFERNHAYVPGDALGWFARTIHPTRTFEERARGKALSLLSPLGLPTGATITPCFAFAAVAGPVAEARNPVLLSHGAERVILLFLPDRLLKIPRLPQFERKTVREQETLAQVRGELDPETARALPEPVGTVRHGNVLASVERYAPGRSLIVARGGERDLRLAAEWLTRFHLQTILRRESWDGREVAQAFDTWASLPGTTRAETALLERTRSRSRELAGEPFPIVLRHRDFTPWNVLRNGAGRIRVLDWEGARPGPALCDLLHFIDQWNELQVGAVTPEERLRAFSPGASPSRREVARYCERLEIDPRFVPLLHVYTRVEIALRSPLRGIDAEYVVGLAERVTDLFPDRPSSDV